MSHVRDGPVLFNGVLARGVQPDSSDEDEDEAESAVPPQPPSFVLWTQPLDDCSMSLLHCHMRGAVADTCLGHKEVTIDCVNLAQGGSAPPRELDSALVFTPDADGRKLDYRFVARGGKMHAVLRPSTTSSSAAAVTVSFSEESS